MIYSHSSPGQRFVDWLIIRLSRSINIDGLWVGVFSEKCGEIMLVRVGEALRLIKTYDPNRYRMVLKEIDRLLICLLPCYTAVFVTELRRCLIDPRYILTSSPEFVASAIVHEATHGKLIRRKIGYSEEFRYRVEKVCMRQEWAFAQKIPDGEELRQSIERRLGLAPEFWADEVASKRHREGEVAMARYAGIPNWLVMTLLNFRKLRANGQH